MHAHIYTHTRPPVLVWLLATGSMQHSNGLQCVMLGCAEQHDAYCTNQVCLNQMTAVVHHASPADLAVLHRRMLRSVRAYCETRGLPADLQQRLLSYFEFQQQKAMDSDGSRILRALPDSLRMKVASHQYSYVIQRNSMLFKGCNLQFLNQLMLKLREMYLMPGETLIRAGDMSRELAFVARVCTSTAHCSITIAMTLMMWVCFITHGYASVLPIVLSLLL